MYEYQIVINTLVPKNAKTVILDEVNEANSSDVLRIRFKLSESRPEDVFVQFAERFGVKKLVLVVKNEWPGLMFDPEHFGRFPDDFAFAIFTQEKWTNEISDR